MAILVANCIKLCPNTACKIGGKYPLRLAQDDDGFELGYCRRCYAPLQKFHLEVVPTLNLPALGKRPRPVSEPDDAEDTTFKKQKMPDGTNTSMTEPGNEVGVGGGMEKKIETRVENGQTWKWCLTCSSGDHSTEQCGAFRTDPAVSDDLLSTEIGWQAIDRHPWPKHLERQPKDILQVMDLLEVHCQRLRNAKGFQASRDWVMASILELDCYMQGLQRGIKTDHWIRDIFQTQIAKANHCTVKFLRTIQCHIFTTYNKHVKSSPILKPRQRITSEIRIKIAHHIAENPSSYPVHEQSLNTLRENIQRSWDKYVKDMDTMEKSFITTHWRPGIVEVEQTYRLLRLPTSYFRLTRPDLNAKAEPEYFDTKDEDDDEEDQERKEREHTKNFGPMWCRIFKYPRLYNRTVYFDINTRMPADPPINVESLGEAMDEIGKAEAKKAKKDKKFKRYARNSKAKESNRATLTLLQRKKK